MGRANTVAVGFQDRCLKPLGHPSKSAKSRDGCNSARPGGFRAVLLDRMGGQVQVQARPKAMLWKGAP